MDKSQSYYQQMVEAAPARRAKVVRMHEEEGMPFRAIADEFGVTPARIWDIYRQAKKLAE